MGNRWSNYRLVKDFHEVFKHPVADSPQILSDERVINRSSWIMEEVIELLFATAGNNERFDDFYNTLIDKMENTYQRQLNKEFPEDVLTAQADACADGLYFFEGNFVEMGIESTNIFRIVHQSNMSKLFEGGEARFNEDGKVIKSPYFVPPEEVIREEIDRQIEENV
jgi:predicted HAD superfamily Cof-like phosphohydrolase